MEICKAPTLRLKALNKHSITHLMYNERGNVISNLKKKEKKKEHILLKASIRMLLYIPRGLKGDHPKPPSLR